MGTRDGRRDQVGVVVPGQAQKQIRLGNIRLSERERRGTVTANHLCIHALVQLLHNGRRGIHKGQTVLFVAEAIGKMSAHRAHSENDNVHDKRWGVPWGTSRPL